MSIAPLPRFSKENWLNLHNNHCKSIITSNYSTLLIGHSLINGLSRYTNTWKRYLKPLDAINLVSVETEFKIFCGNVSIYQNPPL